MGMLVFILALITGIVLRINILYRTLILMIPQNFVLFLRVLCI